MSFKRGLLRQFVLVEDHGSFVEDNKPLDTIYAVLVGDRKVIHYGIQDVIYLIELGIVHPQAYLYCYDSHSWKKPLEIEKVKDRLRMETKERRVYSEESPPDFIPPPPPLSPHFSLDEYFEETREESSSPDAIKEHENQIVVLKEANEFLRRDFEDSERNLLHWQNLYHKEKTTKDKIKERFLILKEENEDMKIRLRSFDNSKEDEKKDKQLLQKRMREAREENAKLARAIKKLGGDKRQLKVYVKDLEDQLNGALKGRENLRKDLKKREGDLIKMKKREVQAKKLIKNLGAFKESTEVQQQAEVDRLIGESFEVSNEPNWMVKQDGEEKGPYKFSHLRDLLNKRMIKGKTLIRKRHEKTFSRLEKVYEFNTRVFTKIEKNDQGETEERYFIKRTDFRAPFYEVALLEYEGREFRGHCTSLSIGGCFIEFPSLPKGVALNSVLKCHIQADYLTHPIDVQMIVRNVSEGRPVGIGCQFLDLSTDEKDTIEEFVDSYLKSKSMEKMKVA